MQTGDILAKMCGVLLYWGLCMSILKPTYLYTAAFTCYFILKLLKLDHAHLNFNTVNVI